MAPVCQADVAVTWTPMQAGAPITAADLERFVYAKGSTDTVVCHAALNDSEANVVPGGMALSQSGGQRTAGPCVVSYAGRAIASNSFKYLVNDEIYGWVAVDGKPGGVDGGSEHHGRQNHGICQVGATLGKDFGGSCYYPAGGREVTATRYDVLKLLDTKPPAPNAQQTTVVSPCAFPRRLSRSPKCKSN